MTEEKPPRRTRGPAKAKNKKPYIAALDKGEMPLEYMLRVMRDPSAEPERRDLMAAKAAPYCHRQLKALEVTGPEGGPIEQRVVLSFD